MTIENLKNESFDLSAFSLNEMTKKIANLNFFEEGKDKNGNYMLRGLWRSDLCYQFASTCGFELVKIDGYSSYAYSDEQKAIFGYCEGDITLTLYTDTTKYEKGKNNIIKFYKEYY
jgi:hypothetical protein